MRALVTGGMGFIGCYLTEELLRRGWDVVVMDNLSSGKVSNLNRTLRSEVEFVVGDCTRFDDVREVLAKETDVVFHFAADPEVRAHLNDAANCYYQNVFGTHVILQEMKRVNVQQFVFASSSTVYGEPSELPTRESSALLYPISPYGVSKLMAEELSKLACSDMGTKSTILRLANIVGAKSKRGVIADFIAKLTENPSELEILGDGSQTKSYLHVRDCVDGIMVAAESQRNQSEILNVGANDQISVAEIARIVINEMGLRNVAIVHVLDAEGGRGWAGDVKNMLLATQRLRSRGWFPKWNSQEAVRLATRELLSKNQAHVTG